MTVQQIVEEINFIKKDNDNCHKIIEETNDIALKSEYRERILENNNQLMHWKSVLASIKYDPNF